MFPETNLCDFENDSCAIMPPGGPFHRMDARTSRPAIGEGSQGWEWLGNILIGSYYYRILLDLIGGWGMVDSSEGGIRPIVSKSLQMIMVIPELW